MKVVCISRGEKCFESQFCGGYYYDQYRELTIGKVYIADLDIIKYYYRLIDDNGKLRVFDKKLFMGLKEHRKMKLEKLNESR